MVFLFLPLLSKSLSMLSLTHTFSRLILNYQIWLSSCKTEQLLASRVAPIPLALFIPYPRISQKVIETGRAWQLATVSELGADYTTQFQALSTLNSPISRPPTISARCAPQRQKAAHRYRFDCHRPRIHLEEQIRHIVLQQNSWRIP